MARASWIRRLGTTKSGFRYVTDTGAPVRATAVLERIDALRIPPAYTDVHIAGNPNASIQAWGFDARGRRQYRYHPRAVERGQLRKYHRVARLGRDLPTIRSALTRDLRGPEVTKRRAAAAVLLLISEGYLRIGEERYERENHSYGATTLRKSHATVQGPSVTLHFIGKRGIPQRHEVRDRRLARIIAELKRTPGHRLFRYETPDGWADLTSRDVNAYLRTLARVPYTSKDFRTWGGTLRCALALADAGPADSERKAKQQVVTAVRLVAETLGNTPAISRKSYVHPLVIGLYIDRGLTIAEYLKRRRAARRLSAEEWALSRFLDTHFPDRRRIPRVA
jgi:DNA topoisomerase-1